LLDTLSEKVKLKEYLMDQSELLSKITKAASVITKMGNRGSADYVIASESFLKFYMKIGRPSHRKSKIIEIYGNLE